MPSRTAERPVAFRGRELAAVVAFWALLALGAGSLQYAATRVAGGGPGWTEHLAPPATAAVIWVPLTSGILWLARRWPPPPLGPPRGAAVHVLGAVAVSFVLNAGFVALRTALGGIVPADFGREVLATGLRWMHLNAGAYLAIVLVGIGTRSLEERASETSAVVDRLEVSSGSGTVYLAVDEIDWIEGAGDYACVHAGERELLCDRRLKELERSLAPRAFVRVHRSRIVNLDRVRAMRHLSHGDYEAELVGGQRLRVSRGRREQVLAALERLTLESRSDAPPRRGAGPTS